MAAQDPPGMMLSSFADYKHPLPESPQLTQSPQPGAPSNQELRKQKIRGALKGMAEARPAPMQPLIQLKDLGTPQPKEIDYMEA